MEKRKLEKVKDSLSASTSKDAAVPIKKAAEKPKESTKRKEKEESKEVKSKKRARDDEDENDEGVIQGAFGKRAVQDGLTKHKKVSAMQLLPGTWLTPRRLNWIWMRRRQRSSLQGLSNRLPLRPNRKRHQLGQNQNRPHLLLQHRHRRTCPHLNSVMRTNQWS